MRSTRLEWGTVGPPHISSAGSVRPEAERPRRLLPCNSQILDRSLGHQISTSGNRAKPAEQLPRNAAIRRGTTAIPGVLLQRSLRDPLVSTSARVEVGDLRFSRHMTLPNSPTVGFTPQVGRSDTYDQRVPPGFLCRAAGEFVPAPSPLDSGPPCIPALLGSRTAS